MSHSSRDRASAIIPEDRASSHYDNFIGKLVLKRPCVGDSRELSSTFTVWVQWEIELQAILPGDRVLN